VLSDIIGVKDRVQPTNPRTQISKSWLLRNSKKAVHINSVG